MKKRLSHALSKILHQLGIGTKNTPLRGIASRAEAIDNLCFDCSQFNSFEMPNPYALENSRHPQDRTRKDGFSPYEYFSYK